MPLQSMLACRPDHGSAQVGNSDVVGSDSAGHVRPPLPAGITADAEYNPKGLAAVAAAARYILQQQGSRPASDAGGALAARRSSRGRQLQLHWLSSSSTSWLPRVRCQRWVQSSRCKLFGYDWLHCPTHKARAAHSSGPACRLLETAALIRLHQPALQKMKPGHWHWARRLHPAGLRWNLHSWQVSCCQAGCIRAA